MSRIDRSNIQIKKKGFQFKPFRPQAKHEILLIEAGLAPEQELVLFERGGQRRAILVPEAAYHHVIQGELAGEPYLVSF